MVNFKITDKSAKHMNDNEKFILESTVKIQNSESSKPSGDPNIKHRGIRYK